MQRLPLRGRLKQTHGRAYPLGRRDDPQAGDFGSGKLKIGTCQLFQIALCRMSGGEWSACHPAVWEEHDAGPSLCHPIILTKLAHQAAAGAPAPQIVVRWLALADTALEQRVVFVFFIACLSSGFSWEALCWSSPSERAASRPSRPRLARAVARDVMVIIKSRFLPTELNLTDHSHNW